MPAILKLLISVVVVMAIGISASFFTGSSVNGWFTTIEKPSWNPPSWLFAPVWTILYVMIGLALYRLWTSPSSSLRSIAIGLFCLQMALNFAWSLIFFGRQQVGWALVDILFLWVVIGGCILIFTRVSPVAAKLFIPYWLWVSFATALNYAIWQLNGN